MKAGEIMINPSLTLPSETITGDAIKAIAGSAADFAVLLDKDGSFQGVVTIKGLMAGALSEDGPGKSAIAFREKGITCVSPGSEAENLINERGPWPVIQKGRLAGVITRSILTEKLFLNYRKKAAKLNDILNSLHNADSNKQLTDELNAIIEYSFDGIYVTDGQGNTLRVNKAHERTTGIKAGEVIGKNMARLVREGYYDQSVTLLVLEKKEPMTIIQEIRKTGKIVLVTGTPIFDENGEVFRVVTNVRDITELNQLKQQLEEAQLLTRHYETQLNRYKIKYGAEHQLIFKSNQMEAVVDLVMRLAQVDTTVLIQGESGVGKELVAELIHRHSHRKDGPFIRINCGAIPEELMESELFGYESGAFTGAKKGGKPGHFEIARNGTIFLDEIGDMPLNLQVKLLRVLQSREIMRVGGIKAVKIDVRIIAATNRNLEKMVQEEKFREDLYYRLNVVPVNVPPLRKRKEDLPPLVAHFMEKYNQRYDMNKRISPRVMELFMHYDWPGNVRELQNLLERVIVITPGEMITAKSLPINLQEPAAGTMRPKIAGGDVLVPLNEAVENLERELITRAFAEFGTTRRVARALGISQPSVVRKAAKYCIKSGA
ncbi:PAS domain S-box-containing protein [Desulfotomaculum arcticum]|uniref:HTH-type transcriptional regulatory protein TyrR n=1 Tax=Desulfotruncus arcticus DSM 17038 TaxID=1121424 RepID=A0A1I2RJ68_9FIRM|nr:sigma 54-interacting transcriptional regulator [Desulfotruncus arcticus]SFG37816.1 PAS domain S-box-containing protein [Desulfotomaculum arcticum] [Desulfotruncus arcticus DSM 17038]